ncbi:tetratricopeptide repeat protein [Polynucleobacter paneuropaeus]|nr:tetratricopeptide repeat protein [Polynucleobacter paneuropaeus]
MSTESSTPFHQAIKAFHESDFANAEYLLFKYLNENPNHFDACHLLAIVLANQGMLEEANKQYQLALTLNPSSISALSNWGACLNLLGQHRQAIQVLEKALSINQTIAALWFNTANILCDAGEFNKACIHYEKALSLDTEYFQAYNNYGKALFNLDLSSKALEQYERALGLNPDFAEAWSNKGNALNQLMRYAEALDCYERALSLNPEFPEAWSNKGITLQAIKQYEQALHSYNKAIALKPNFAEAWSNKGNTRNELKRYAEALECYDQSLALNPNYAEAWSNKGITLQALKQYEQALHSYNKAIALKPNFAEAWSNKGNALNELKRYQEALECYDHALVLNPSYIQALSNKANIFVMMKLYEEALIPYQKALSVQFDHEWIEGAFLDCEMKMCSWNNVQEKTHLLSQKIGKNEKVINPFQYISLDDDAGMQKKCAEIYIAANDPTSDALEHLNNGQTKPRIRIGYFSADYRKHPTAQLMAELFELHDRSRFEIFAFSLKDPVKDDPLRRRIKTALDHFYEFENKTDQEIAQLVRDLEIDIAIDLGGHTQFARSGVFACRAAPIQVNYLGYPGTMGAPYIDYIVADPTLIPEANQGFYTEKIVYLPNTYQPNDRKRQIAPKQFSKSELGLPEQGFIFSCFNNNFKINPQVFDSWARILTQVPGSILWLLEDNHKAKENLQKEAIARGIDKDRLIFASRLETSEHLARHALADLFLDTFPYNAHTTASDALWAGLPVLTLIGQSFAARVAASLLNAIDLPELITHTQAEYESLAIELATHPERLAQIKQKLQIHRLTKPLFDTPRYTKNIEAAYAQMYERSQAGLPPDHLYI